MTKSEMVAAVAKEAGLPKKAAAAAFDAIGELITTELKKGNPVVLTGLAPSR